MLAWDIIKVQECSPLDFLDKTLPNNLLHAALYNNLGCMEYSEGSIAKARTFLRMAETFGEKTLHQESICNTNCTHVGTILYNKGILNVYMRLHNEAIQMFDVSLSLQKRALGEHHSDVAIIQNVLGNIYLAISRVKNAMSAFNESLLIFRLNYGNEHIYASKVLFNIANVYGTIGEYSEALHTYKETLRIEQLVLGMQHLDTAVTLYKIAQIHQNKGDYDEGFNYYNQALCIVNTKSNKNQSLVISILCQILHSYIQSGNFSYARKVYTSIIQRIQKTEYNLSPDQKIQLAHARYLFESPPAAGSA